MNKITTYEYILFEEYVLFARFIFITLHKRLFYSSRRYKRSYHEYFDTIVDFTDRSSSPFITNVFLNTSTYINNYYYTFVHY